jgi:hypothetical protein
MAGEDRPELEAAGVIDSKFGAVAWFRRPGRFDAAKSWLGFLRPFDDPAANLRMVMVTSGSELDRATRGHCQHARPADPAGVRKRTEAW